MADLTAILGRNGVTCRDLVNHAFLPKRLPQSEEPNLEDIEQALLESLASTVETSLAAHSLLGVTTQLFSSWTKLQRNPLQLRSQLQQLDTGHGLCLYVRKQNCTLFFTKLDEDSIRIVAFRGSLPNDRVMSSSGSLVVTYPEVTEVVPISPLFLSDCFTKQVDHLCKTMYEIAMPKTEKGGKAQVETREPSFPFMVSEFLVGVLCPTDTEDLKKIQNAVKIQKKVRDQINWANSALPFRRSGMWMSAKVILQMSIQEEIKNKTDAYLLYKMVILEMLANIAEQEAHQNGSWDVASQIMAKLHASRIFPIMRAMLAEHGSR